ncbi:DUF3618 domain-containing protein [Pseudomonas typographi]|uniref:DUF3618 domain-containing protein n=1 Tax=Pseudomonas typographi TaxID=2715964 RepID=A0ABR7Z759_9PSED|nr:DUF3618 domain-containing protein [Pseudomonas typographi]MBD1587166.1 DUF3618 domain-containing protein [Pseudomonas typographi]MBD1601384.1 DUF3618 domain-containing protein [Pseudomonas typographi]
MSPSFETESHKSPQTLEREIDAKRTSISHIVDSLESRFTPGQLFDQALAYTKGHGGEFFQNLGTTVKNNPLPTVLAGVGLAWLAINQNKPFRPGPPATGPGLGEQLSHAAQHVSDALSQVGDRLHSASDTARDKAGAFKGNAAQLSDRATDSLNASAGQVRQAAHDTRERAHSQAVELKSQFNRLAQEQPLVLAAVGIALGAALGACLPSTDKENELLGDARDDLAAKVKSKGQQAYAEVKDSVNQAGEAAAAGPPSGAPKVAPPATDGTDLSAGLGMNP